MSAGRREKTFPQTMPSGISGEEKYRIPAVRAKCEGFRACNTPSALRVEMLSATPDEIEERRWYTTKFSRIDESAEPDPVLHTSAHVELIPS